MDIQGYFKLNEKPFLMGPDPRFLYFSDQVKLAMAKSEYYSQERIAPVYMYGPIGSGKTTILRRLYEKISQEEHYTVRALITPDIKTSNAFLRYIMESFDVKTERSYDQSLKNFQQFLQDEYVAGRTPVLIIDEAQNMNRSILKLVHFLLNYETATTKLLQIVLAGQEELSAKIMRYRELASRMFPIAINAMSPQELEEMIKFRWMVAGGTDNPFEGKEVFETLFDYSKGLPRDAIKICDEVLRLLMFTDRTKATKEDIDQIAKEINLSV